MTLPLLDRVQANTATTGTGAVTLGSATAGYQSWSAGGAVSGQIYPYLIQDTGNAWEIGYGIYSSTGPSLTRTLLASSTGSLLNLSGAANVSCAYLAENAFGKGVPIFSRAVLTSALRTSGTVYQNTSGFPMIVSMGATSSTPTAVCDSASSPTNTVWSASTFNGGGTSPCIFVVPPNYYYKVTWGGTFSYWVECTFNIGSCTDSGNLTGSRSLSSVYQNTGPGVMMVEVGVTGATTMQAVCDSGSSPASVVAYLQAWTSPTSVFFLVPAGYYYEVTSSSGTLSYWHEYAFTFNVTRSANLNGFKGLNRTYGIPSVQNQSGSSMLTQVVCTGNSSGTLSGLVGSSVGLNNPSVWNCAQSGWEESIIALSNPLEFFAAYQDSQTNVNSVTSWFEYTF